MINPQILISIVGGGSLAAITIRAYVLWQKINDPTQWRSPRSTDPEDSCDLSWESQDSYSEPTTLRLQPIHTVPAHRRPVCDCSYSGESLFKRRGHTGHYMYRCMNCKRKNSSASSRILH